MQDLEVRLLLLPHRLGIGQALLEAALLGGAAAQLWVARGNPRVVR